MYCDQSDIIKAISEEILIQLTDDENLDVVNQDNVILAIQTADAEIDGYCGGKYAVPFAVAPPIVKGLSVEVATYYLYKRRTVPEEVEKAYDKAISRLKDIARGLLSLGVDPPPPATTTEGGPEASKSASDRLFTMRSMRGF